MADNVELDPGTGGAIIATDDAGVGGQVQIIKLAISADGSATVIPADTANGLDVDVTRSALPTGASTAANQATVIGHLDGVEGLLTTIDGDTGTISTNSGTIAGAVSGTEMQVDVVAALPAGNNNIGDVDVASSALPSGASTSANQTTIIGHLDGVEGILATMDADTGAIMTAVQLLDNTIFVDDAAFTPGTSSVSAVGLLADQASTDSVNEGDIGIPRMTLTRQAIVTAAPSVDTEGATIAMNIDVDETEDAVKASAGKILGWYMYNDGAAEVYVKFYNDTTANVIVGTTVPVLTIPLPAGSAANVSFGDIGGIPFSAAITIAATTGAATADTGAPAANQVIANVLYV